MKAINAANPGGEPQVRSAVIEELQVLRAGDRVRSLSIVRVAGQEDRLLVVSDNTVTTIPLQRCASFKITNCRSAISLSLSSYPKVASDSEQNPEFKTVTVKSGVDLINNVNN